MALLSESILYDICVTVVTVALSIVLFYKWWFTYWSRRGIETLKPSIPWGDVANLMSQKSFIGEVGRNFYEQFKSRGLKHGGIYILARPYYVPIDLEIIKNMLTKDFNHFVNHGTYINEESDPLSGHLFGLEDAKWKNVRAKLSPTFTSGKMKMMFPTLANCSIELENIINEAAKDKTSIEIKDIIARYTTDVIGSCAFGIECNTLKTVDSPFRKFGTRTFENTSLEAVQTLIAFVFPRRILTFFNFTIIKKDVESFFVNLVQRTVAYREKNNISRNDFLNLLIQLKNKGHLDDSELKVHNPKNLVEMSMKELTAQVFVFYLAGFETSSTTANFALYELAQQQDIQHKLRKEINKVLEKYGEKYTYEGFMEMKYMDQVINETLRKYPPVPILNRICTKEYTVPKTDVTIEKGTMVMIPTMGIHYDPEIYENPERFNPDRFSDENKDQIPSCAWLPFGEGPRICIGLRFGVMQIKVALTTILKNHRVTLDPYKTKTPPKMQATSFVTSVEGGVWLNVSKVES